MERNNGIYPFLYIVVSTILNNPPSVKFYAGASLELSAVPISEMLEAEEESSSALHRTYSSASEDTVDSITPNSSYGSMQMRKGFSGRNLSTDSFCSTDISDAENSLNQSQLRLQNSSGSPDGSILFSPPGIPVAGGFPPRRNPSSSASLSSVPEHGQPGELVTTNESTMYKYCGYHYRASLSMFNLWCILM